MFHHLVVIVGSSGSSRALCLGPIRWAFCATTGVGMQLLIGGRRSTQEAGPDASFRGGVLQRLSMPRFLLGLRFIR
jgi:hypothetical protein